MPILNNKYFRDKMHIIVNNVKQKLSLKKVYL
jgi:hypothetical protein